MVRARRVGGELRLLKLDGATRLRALELARAYVDGAGLSVGRCRGELEADFAAISVQARDRRLALGLRKLVLDRCTFEPEPEVDPRELRLELFRRASAAWQGLEADADFGRDPLIAGLAAERGLTAERLEQLLYADLRAAHELLSFAPIAPEALVEAYELAQAQAVLLRAVRVEVNVESANPAVYRQLFRKLKFLRLLCTIQARPAGEGYRLIIDGPYSMFRAVTKYGLQLALLLPAIRACDRWSLEADVKWAKRGQLTFRQAGAREGEDGIMASEELLLPREVSQLKERFDRDPGPWRAQLSRELLVLQGVGVCVPDLVFEHCASGRRVYVEVLGYWSRRAVWQRVRLVEQGLAAPILFAISEQLRVSEAALAGDAPAALYVYKNVMSRKAIEQKLDALCAPRERARRPRAAAPRAAQANGCTQG